MQAQDMQQQAAADYDAAHQQQMAAMAAAGGAGEFVPATTTVLRLRGLPYSATNDDVVNFFEGFELGAPLPEGSEGTTDPVLIITQGFHRGEGYVRFANANECQRAAAAKNRARMGDRYVEVYPSNDTAMAAAHRQQQQLLSEVHFVVRLRGLPYQAGEETIRAFFAHVAPYISLITFCTGADGRNTGDAFVEFQSRESLTEALTFNRRTIGVRYIEIFDSSAQERDAITMVARRYGTQRGGMRGGRGGQMVPGGMHPAMYAAAGVSPYGGMYPAMAGGGRGGRGGGYPVAAGAPRVSPFVIRVRGLPFQATEAQVAEFLQGVNILPQGVHMVYNAADRPTGEAFVEVSNEQDVGMAVRYDRRMMGHRYVEVYASSPAEMARLQGVEQVPMQAYAPQQYVPQQAYGAVYGGQAAAQQQSVVAYQQAWMQQQQQMAAYHAQMAAMRGGRR